MQEKPFSQKVRGRETFSNNHEAYGYDGPLPKEKVPEKRKPLTTHDVPFKPANPAKKGYNRTIDKFPEYKEDPLRVVKRKQPAEDAEKGKWKSTHRVKTMPTPSVTTNYRNLKSEFPSVFRRL